MRAFILAAGLGTRLKPITDSIPKALVSVNGKPLLQICIERLKKFGINKLVVNVHHFADKVINFLNENDFGIELQISDEKDLLLDTGGGLKKAMHLLNDKDSILVHNVDIISDLDLLQLSNFHSSKMNIATLAVQKRKSSRYFLFDEEKNLCGWKNCISGEIKVTRDPVGELNEFAFSGIHIAAPEIFNHMPEEKVFSLVDLYLSTATNNKISYFDHSDSRLIDVGKKENIILAEKFLKGIS